MIVALEIFGGCRTRRRCSGTPTRSWRRRWARRASRSPPREALFYTTLMPFFVGFTVEIAVFPMVFTGFPWNFTEIQWFSMGFQWFSIVFPLLKVLLGVGSIESLRTQDRAAARGLMEGGPFHLELFPVRSCTNSITREPFQALQGCISPYTAYRTTSILYIMQ